MHTPQLAYTPGQLLKKVAQATPKGLLHLFVLDSETFQPAFSFDPSLALVLHIPPLVLALHIPSLKEINVSFHDGIQFRDSDDDFDTIVTKIWHFMQRW